MNKDESNGILSDGNDQAGIAIRPDGTVVIAVIDDQELCISASEALHLRALLNRPDIVAALREHAPGVTIGLVIPSA
jgi:hypothetical protein